MFMNKKLLLATVIGGLSLLGAASLSNAATIEYSAIGLFANNTNVYNFGTATLTFNNLGTTSAGVIVDTNTNNPTNANFGTFFLPVIFPILRYRLPMRDLPFRFISFSRIPSRLSLRI